MKALRGIALVAALASTSAFAAQNVANTSQKGSLLIWPLVDIDNGNETFIEISNDSSRLVHVECYYVNEKKGRVDFDFELTGKATASWAVKSMDGDQVNPPAFPTGGSWGGPAPYPVANANRGELVCFAVNPDVTGQIAFNHLTGNATVTHTPADPVVAPDQQSVFRYNSWAFVARNATGLPQSDNARQGVPGILVLSGDGAGTYDACPIYNIGLFMPNGAVLGDLTTHRNALTVVSCNQDLRQDYQLNLTKLQFTVWNSKEQSYTGAYICVDSVNSVYLTPENTFLKNGGNFNYTTLRTQNARFIVRGVASTQCPSSKASGLLGVLTADTSAGRTGTTTHGAGAQPGFVLWDPQGATPFRAQ